jgi:hypothetical protein
MCAIEISETFEKTEKIAHYFLRILCPNMSKYVQNRPLMTIYGQSCPKTDNLSAESSDRAPQNAKNP